MASRGFSRIDQRARRRPDARDRGGGWTARAGAATATRRQSARAPQGSRAASLRVSAIRFAGTFVHDFLHARSASAPRRDRPRAAAPSPKCDAQVVLRHSSCRRRGLPATASPSPVTSAHARADRAAVRLRARRASRSTSGVRSARSSRNRSGMSLTLLTTTSTSPSLSKSANAAPRPAFGRRHRRPEPLGDVREPAVAEIAIDDLALLVAGLGLQLLRPPDRRGR